ncbi:MAG: phospholipid carrier-dependent glycosyltransferase, partial [Deltaproteobacteria bacterium]|nr:phospholipid carrier-dependent glycosyltransferase [Deltaproteobacteria bacterium]
VQDNMMLLLTSIVTILAFRFFSRLSVPKESYLSAVVAGTLLGLAVMTKSIAAYYPFAVVGVYGLLSWQLPAAFRLRWKWIAVVLALSIVIPASFYVPHFLAEREAYQGAIQHEVVGRFEKGYHNRLRPDYYFRILQSGALAPAIALGVSTLFFVYQGLFLRRNAFLFVLVWAIVPIAAYSMLPSRLIWYIAPSYLPIALMVGETTRAAMMKSWELFRSCTGCSWRGLVGRIVALLCCFAFATSTLMKGARAVTTTASKVYSAEARLPLDHIVEEILPIVQAGPANRILVFDAPAPANNERVYMNMLSPYIQHVATREDFRSQLREQQNAFAITSVSLAEEVLASDDTARYAVLPHNVLPQEWHGVTRPTPIVFFALNTKVTPARYHPPVTRHVLAEIPKEKLLHGWSRRTWSGKARISIGQGSALFLPGDLLLEHAGATVTIEAARMGDSTNPGLHTRVLLNSREIGVMRDISLNFKRFEFTVPPHGLVGTDQNLVELLSSYDDGRAIVPDTKVLLIPSIAVKPLAPPPHEAHR